MSERKPDFEHDGEEHGVGEDVPMREYSIDEEAALEENLEDDELDDEE